MSLQDLGEMSVLSGMVDDDNLLNPLQTHTGIATIVQGQLGGVNLGNDGNVTLITLVIDASGSLLYRLHNNGQTNADIFEEGVNSLIRLLKNTDSEDSIIVQCVFITDSSTVKHIPFNVVDMFPQLNATTYDRSKFGGTPLYYAIYNAAVAHRLKQVELRQQKRPSKGLFIIMTDGMNEVFNLKDFPTTSDECYNFVQNLVSNEVEPNVVVAFGLCANNSSEQNMRQNLMSCGVENDFILTTSDDLQAFLQKMGFLSQTISGASSSSASFSRFRKTGFK